MVIKHLFPREVTHKLCPKQWDRAESVCVRVCVSASVCARILICCLRRWASSPAVLPNYVTVPSSSSLLMETILINYACASVSACVHHCAFCASVRASSFPFVLPFCLFIYLFSLCGSPPTQPAPVFRVLISWELVLICHAWWQIERHGTIYKPKHSEYICPSLASGSLQQWRQGLFRSSLPIFGLVGYTHWQSAEVKVNTARSVFTCGCRETHLHARAFTLWFDKRLGDF